MCTAFHSVAQNIEAAGAQHYHDRWMKHSAYEQGDLVCVDLPAASAVGGLHFSGITKSNVKVRFST